MALEDARDLNTKELVNLLSASSAVDISAITTAADAVRQRIVGDHVTYVVNRNINFTNVCVKKCNFCAFSRTGAASEGYYLPAQEVLRRAAEAVAYGASEVCVQAGLPPAMPPQLYANLARAIKQQHPTLNLHAFSPEEILYASSRGGGSVREVLLALKDAGVTSLPGTSAEILVDSVREKLAPGRLSSQQWVDVVCTAHSVGLPTTSTVMYGHLETPAHLAAHLQAIVAAQRRSTGCPDGTFARVGNVPSSDAVGITEFVPLSFVAADSPLFTRQAAALRAALQGMRGDPDSVCMRSSADAAMASPLVRGGPSGREVLLMHAVARLALRRDVPNIQGSWVKEGLRMAQVLLDAGANDLGGTLMNESISTAAGALHGQLMRPSSLREAARAVGGRTPVERDTMYNSLRCFPEQRPEGGALLAELAKDPLECVAEGEAGATFGTYSQLTAASTDRFKDLFKRDGAALDGARRRHARRGARGGVSSPSSATAAAATATAVGGTAGGARRLMRTAAGKRIQRDAPDAITVTFSPACTLVPTYECFNNCTYCNFRTNPPADGSTQAWLTPSKAAEQLGNFEQEYRMELGGAEGGAQCASLLCEVLVMAGEVAPRSERRGAWVQNAYATCKAALQRGLLPHTNIGPLSRAEMLLLRGVNASMGLMLEQVTPALMAAPRGVHRFAPSKEPMARLQQLRQAGELHIPFTTGVLLGIGEGQEDARDSVRAIAEVAAEYGHIQEVILQPHSQGSSQRDKRLPHFDVGKLPELVRFARGVLPADVVVQVPPNLVAKTSAVGQSARPRMMGAQQPAQAGDGDVSLLLDCVLAGARDVGGLGPKDEVNPDWAFPGPLALQAALTQHGVQLQPRAPVHDRFVTAEWLSEALLPQVQRWQRQLPAMWRAALEAHTVKLDG